MVIRKEIYIFVNGGEIFYLLMEENKINYLHEKVPSDKTKMIPKKVKKVLLFKIKQFIEVSLEIFGPMGILLFL